MTKGFRCTGIECDTVTLNSESKIFERQSPPEIQVWIPAELELEWARIFLAMKRTYDSEIIGKYGAACYFNHCLCDSKVI